MLTALTSANFVLRLQQITCRIDSERYRFSIYDSMLLASALEAGCRTFYREDLHHGQRIEGLTIRNPFQN